jgi:hypothetical protein
MAPQHGRQFAHRGWSGNVFSASQIISCANHASLPFVEQRTNGLRRKSGAKQVSNSDFDSGLIHTQNVAARFAGVRNR